MREWWQEPFLDAAKELGTRAAAARAADVPLNTVRFTESTDPAFGREVRRLCPRVRSLNPFGLLLALALLLPGSLAATTSAPVQLGEAGLDLVVGLRRWQETAPDSWPAASTAGVTVNDLGDGAYTVSGLPLATGTDRYSLTLALEGDEDRGLVTYTYGAQPGVRLVWQQEVELPSAPAIFKQGDTFGSLSMVVRRRLPAAACEPETTATITVANAATGAALFTDRAAAISNCVLDSTTGSYGLTLSYDLQAGDTATVARYLGEFKVCYSPSSCQTLPADNRLRFEVVRRLGG